MAVGYKIPEMICPKCKQYFEEGSRRFCPSDGARLLSEDAPANDAPRDRGIFSHIIAKSEVFKEADDKISERPKFSPSESRVAPFEPPQLKFESNEPFFEIEDMPDVDDSDEDFLNFPLDTPKETITEEEPKTEARKVNLHEIPAGHVDLNDSYRPPAGGNDFDFDRPEDFIGRTVKGRYKVNELFEEFPTGFAFLADDKIVPNRTVLVYVLRNDDQDEIMESIYSEERVSLSHFSHPNIAKLIDSGEFTDGTRFLISEFVDALTVRDILSIHERLELQRAARVIRQAANALADVHQEGILHRDLRPENIIVSAEEGEPEHIKIINFGTSSGQIFEENLPYKAPELLEGRIPTIASDIYSLSVVAFEILTGSRPFKGRTEKEVLNAERGGLTTAASSLNPEIPAEVDTVFQKAFAFNANDRYSKAREFGDAIFSALSAAGTTAAPERPEPSPDPVSTTDAATADAADDAEIKEEKAEVISDKEPVDVSAESKTRALPYGHEPAWKNRSPEPPTTETSKSKLALGAAGILGLLMVLAFGIYYVVKYPANPDLGAGNQAGQSETPENQAINNDIEVPPLARQIAQPPNTDYFQNSKANLKGDLLRNFVGFSLYFPKGWKVNGPQESATPGGRGKFLDIAKINEDGKLLEQMLISYYPSKGTFKDDSEKFPQMVKETTETLKKLIPNFELVSSGETRVNGAWRAYEVKFQGSGPSTGGEKLVVWGRRLFIPAARPGVRDGFEITMLATSLAGEVKNVDEVGVRGDLAQILFSFEPTQNF